MIGRTQALLLSSVLGAASLSAQADAEANDATRTGGEPPEPPPTQTGSTDLLSAARILALLVVGVFFALFAVITWLGVFSEMGDIAERRAPPSASEIAALGLMLIVATAPGGVFLLRRRFALRRPCDAAEGLPVTLGWVIVTIVFVVIAFAGWFGVTLEHLDGLDGRLGHTFDDTLGLTMMTLVTWVPLSLLAWRRHLLRSGDRNAGASDA